MQGAVLVNGVFSLVLVHGRVGEGMGRGWGGEGCPPPQQVRYLPTSHHLTARLALPRDSLYFKPQRTGRSPMSDITIFGKRLMDEDIAEQSGGDNGAVAEWSSEQKQRKQV